MLLITLKSHLWRNDYLNKMLKRTHIGILTKLSKTPPLIGIIKEGNLAI